MKKFQFRLERVLRYHQQRQKQADLRLAQAAMARDAAQNDVYACQKEIELACRLNETVGGAVNPAIRTNVTIHLERLGTILVAAKERLKVCEGQFREQERVRAEITRDVEGVSHLRDLRRREHLDEVNRRMQIDLDEVVMRQWSSSHEDDLPSGIPS